jgi:hypothetical protein
MSIFLNFQEVFFTVYPTLYMQNSMVYTMISPVITISIADKKKLSMTKHPHEAAAANHAKFVDLTKICQPTNTLIRILVRLRLLWRLRPKRSGFCPGSSGPVIPGLCDSGPGCSVHGGSSSLEPH